MDALPIVNTPEGFLFDVGSAREFHECETNQQEALLILRRRPLTKESFEKDRRGARLAPAIEILRNGWGFEILGHGRPNDPYWMPIKHQFPAKVFTTEAIKNAYWDSEHWRKIRDERWAYDNYRCVLCVESCREAIQCHHVVYNLFAEKLDEVMTVCETHHKMIHSACLLKFPTGVDTWMAERLLGLAVYPFADWLLP